ncbi:DUF4148 domain-containing protein [Caballeronia sp. HLA56]
MVKYDLSPPNSHAALIKQKGQIMKLALHAVLVAAAILVPAAAFAQSSEPLTRAQVRAELVQLEKAGYNPLSNCDGNCPDSLQRAEATLMRSRNDAAAAYGPAFDGTQQAGR